MEDELSITEPTQLLVDDITFEGLHTTMMKNGNCALGIYDEIRTFHQSLDVYKKSSSEKTTLLKLYNGGPWKKNTKKDGLQQMKQTRFLQTGMIQPEYIVESLSSPDPEGFWDRYLISCPPERLCRSFELKPLPEDVVSFYALFSTIRQQHLEPVVYNLSQSAVDMFNDYRDNYIIPLKREHEDDTNRRGILSKSEGQLLRLSGILKAMSNALLLMEGIDNETDLEVNEEVMTMAIGLIKYFTEQKFMLLPNVTNVLTNDINVNSVDIMAENIDPLVFSNAGKIRRLLECPEDEVTCSKIVANAMYPKEKCLGDINNSSRVLSSQCAAKFLDKLQKLGLGEVITKCHSHTKKSFIVFRKRKLMDMDSNAQQICKYLKVELKNNTAEVDGVSQN